MNGFERRREQKKESIRRAALQLFSSHGLNKVSINDIAGKAGVSPATIYNHFGSKHELIVDVVRKIMVDLEDEYTAIAHSELPYLERWQQMIFRKSELRNLFHGELVRAIIAEYPEIKDFTETQMAPRLTRLMIDFFNEGKRQGYIRPEVSEQALLIYVEMVQALASSRPEVYEKILSDTKLFQDIAGLLLFGLMGSETHPELLRSFQTDRLE